MAAILKGLLEKQISPTEVVKWLQHSQSKSEEIPAVLQDLNLSKAEFTPFLLNYLRDQTLHLLQGCPSTSPSPAKTPSSVTKLKRKTAVDSPGSNGTTTSTPLPRQGSANRVRLFMNSPMDPLTPAGESFRKKGKPSPNPMTSVSLTFDSPQFSDSSHSTSTSSVFGKDSFIDNSLEARFSKNDNIMSPAYTELFINRTPSHKNKSRTDYADHKASPFQVPEVSVIRHGRNSPSENLRSKHKHSFGEFLSTPDYEIRKKRSPHSRQEGESGRRSTGKKRMRDLRLTQKPLKPTPEKPTEFSLSNDDFPPVGVADMSNRGMPNNVKVITASRRITPTPVIGNTSHGTSSVFQPVMESPEPAAVFKCTGPEFHSPTRALEEERQKLREAKEKVVKKECVAGTPVKATVDADMHTPTKTPSKPNLERLLSSEVLKANPALVAFSEQLHLIADLYSLMLQNHCVPNLTVELYFMVQLLTARGGEMDALSCFAFNGDVEDVNYFGSVHNGVYFAVCVLSQQTKLLGMLDKATVRLLLENSRVEDFSPSLKLTLQELHESLTAKVQGFRCQSPIGGVSFNADTDNRKNFPSDRAFHFFRKQRDQFYEMLRQWEEEHLSPGWNMQDVMGTRIRSLICTRQDLANLLHFTRLFQSQLLQMCRSDQQVKSDGEEDELLLSQLKQTNPEKFKRLQERFITPSSTAGPSPAPGFPGCQEFFRDFIQAAASPLFNQHLTNTMSASIHEVSITTFSNEIERNEDGTVDQEDKELLAKSLATLRILGKFLGFVTFLPYQAPEVLPGSMQADYINMRDKTGLVVDVVGSLMTAEQEGRMVLTVPWLVEFLSMMDPSAPQLQLFHNIFLLLLHIYRVASHYFSITGSLSYLMLTLVLGWFFELPLFPEEIFFSHLDDPVKLIIPSKSLDEQDMVDHHLLYAVCPYLGEIRSLLLGFAVGSNNKGSTIRKITPLSTAVEMQSSVNEKQLEHQLEENFFHNLPASHKRTVEFVADRVASNHIKMFRGSALPDLIQEGQEQVTQLVALLHPNTSLDTKSKQRLAAEVEDVAIKLAERGRKEANDQAKIYCMEKVADILKLLLPEETSDVVLDMSCQICNRYTQDKVNSWLTMHITKAVFIKELNVVMEKRVKVVEKGERCEEGHMEGRQPPDPKLPCLSVLQPPNCHTSLSPSDVVLQFKEVLRQLLLKEEVYGASDVITLIKAIKYTMNNNADLMTGVPKIYGKITVDTAYAIVFLHPGQWSDPLQSAFLDIWTNDLRLHADFARVICVKHIYMIQTSLDPQLSWTKMMCLLHALQQYELVHVNDLETSLKELLNTEDKSLIQGYMEELVVLTCSTAQSYHLVAQHKTGQEFLPVLLSLKSHVDKTQLDCKLQNAVSIIQQLNSAADETGDDALVMPLSKADDAECLRTEQLGTTQETVAETVDSRCIDLPKPIDKHASCFTQVLDSNKNCDNFSIDTNIEGLCSLVDECSFVKERCQSEHSQTPLLDITSDLTNTIASTTTDKLTKNS